MNRLVIKILASAGILFVLLSKASFPVPVFAVEFLIDTDHAGADWTLSNGDVIAGNHTNIGTFTIANGATVTVKAYDGSSDYGTVTVNAADVVIEGTLSGDSKGYWGGRPGSINGQGPGGGIGSNNSGGGGHGGRGANGSNSGYGVANDSETSPAFMGSGGGGGNPAGCIGGAGGAFIRLIAGNTLFVSGTVSSNGANGGYVAGSCSFGGGAGGTIYLTTTDLTGSGLLRANGGSANGTLSGGGGGGRIAVYYSGTGNYSGSSLVNPGPNGFNDEAHYGTVYTEGAGWCPVTDGDAGDADAVIDGTYTIDTNTTWSANGINRGEYDCSDLNFHVTNNATFTLASFDSQDFDWTNDYGSHLIAADFTLDLGSIVSTDATGYRGGRPSKRNGQGPGGGIGSNDAGGGGYGGRGADGRNGLGGSSYGSSVMPIEIGSGGGGQNATGCNGGRGGGAIYLDLTGTAVINGTVSANGGNGGFVSGTCSMGGGSGGAIYLNAPSFSGNGLMRANGGSGNGTYSGGGGGGRIALYYGNVSYEGSMSVIKGSGCGGSNCGANGTTSSIGTPNSASPAQFKSDGTTTLSVGERTNQTTLIFNIEMSDGDASDTLSPEIEVEPVATGFDNIPNATGSALIYSGTTVTGTATASGLLDNTSYHWQARVCDASSLCSSWTSFGNNAESEADFLIATNLSPNLPTNLGPTDVVNGTFLKDSTPTFNFNLTDPDPGQQLHYRFQLDDNSDFSSLIIDYTSAAATASARSFTVGQAVNGGAYSIGTQAQTLSEDGYYWQVKAIDAGSLESSFTTANSGNLAFRVDITAPGITLTPLSPDPTTDTTPTFTGTVSDSFTPIQSVQYQVNATSGTWQNCIATDGNFDTLIEPFSCTITPGLSATIHFLYLRASDTLGNTTQSGSETIDTFTVTTIKTVTDSNDPIVSSNTAETTCSAQLPGIKTPQIYAAIVNGTTSVTLYFTDAEGPLDHYALEFGEIPTDFTYAAGNIGGSGTRTYTVTHLNPGITYHFRVRAFNDCAPGPWSATFSSTTLIPFPAIPTPAFESILTLDEVKQDAKPDSEVPTEISNPSDQTLVPLSYDLEILVTDPQGQPVPGADVTLYSTPRQTQSDQHGIARFGQVEPGDHHIDIAYANYHGSQSISVGGQEEAIKLDITLTPVNRFIDPVFLATVSVAGFIIGLLILYIHKLRST
jgi:hypothetical protein